MKLLLNFISWSIVQLVLSAICTLIYNYTLIDIFKVEISYIQWIGIIVVSACVFPASKSSNKNEGQESDKLNSFVQSIITKNRK